ncbi:hypothetical protein Leryth_020959 [Lithospermum erythrorhizon]|nr:hypothetical protein Leryth_020959 [Lithospermum erythrorhizon]
MSRTTTNLIESIRLNIFPPKRIYEIYEQHFPNISNSLSQTRDLFTTLLALFLLSNNLKMSKKRGLSLDEKREKMLQIFYDSQDFFLLKELEKMGPKKGVISQSVKDVIQTLVDDDLVLKDKIGTSVYFWSLPSCAGNQLRSVKLKLESDIQSSKKRLADLIEQCNALKKGREESDEREVALSELRAVEEKHSQLKNEMGQYSDNDPATFEAKRESY